jgi:hypothetical protein
MDGKTGLERGNGKEMERRTVIGYEEKKGKGIGIGKKDRNIGIKGKKRKGIREKDGYGKGLGRWTGIGMKG